MYIVSFLPGVPNTLINGTGLEETLDILSGSIDTDRRILVKNFFQFRSFTHQTGKNSVFSSYFITNYGSNTTGGTTTDRWYHPWRIQYIAMEIKQVVYVLGDLLSNDTRHQRGVRLLSVW